MLETVNPINTGIRTIFITFDMCIYYLLKFVYELFFNIASFNLIDREMVFNLFSRVQLIIGVFMLFQLVMIIIKGLVNPDTVTDPKSGGATNIIMRIVVSLALLALIVPINIPSPKNEYEKQINNNGILFGTLYSLQYRVLSNNTLGRLILGDDDTNYTSNNAKVGSLSRFANKFTATIIKIFYKPNVDSKGNYICNDGMDKIYRKTVYEDDDTEPFLLIAYAVKTCVKVPVVNVDVNGTGIGLIAGEKYSVSMSFLISTIAGGALVVLLFMITFDVAKRVFQLAALQLLAPIPIITYMDPKGSKDSAFNSWLKLLGTTYADLFIRLAVIYFAFGIINAFIDKFNILGSFENFGEAVASGVDTVVSTGSVRTSVELIRWTFIIMCIALFIFAKDAPKFLKQMLGIKSDKKFFDSFGQALGVGAVAAGTVSSGVAGAVSRYQNTSGDNKGKKIGAAFLGGISGAAGGAINAGRTYFSSKDGNFQGIMEGNRKHAAQLYANAADDSTFKGRMLAGLQSNIGLQNEYDKLQNQVKYYNEAAAAPGRINQAFDGNGTYKYRTDDSSLVKVRDNDGNVISTMSAAQKIREVLASKGYDASKYIKSDGSIIDSKGNIIMAHDVKYSLKDTNDILTRIQATGDVGLITAVDETKKLIQGVRLDEIRTMTREQIEAKVKSTAPADKDWSISDLNAYDAAKLEYDIAAKYISEPEFEPFRDPNTGKIKKFSDASLGWGSAFKFSGGRSKEGAETIQHSPKMSTAAANAKRAQEANKKK